MTVFVVVVAVVVAVVAVDVVMHVVVFSWKILAYTKTIVPGKSFVVKVYLECRFVSTSGGGGGGHWWWWWWWW